MTPLFNEGKGEKHRRQREDGEGEDKGYRDVTGSPEQCRRRLLRGTKKDKL